MIPSDKNKSEDIDESTRIKADCGTVDSSNDSPNSESGQLGGGRADSGSSQVAVADPYSIVQPSSEAINSTLADLKHASQTSELGTSEAIQIVSASESSIQAHEQSKGSHWIVPVWEVSKLVLVPFLILAASAASIIMLGFAQRSGWLSSASGGSESSLVGATSVEVSATSYICPMMCVPPTTKPGRCPVCAMELVPAAAGSSEGPSSKIEIDPRSRRVAGIETVAAVSQTLFQEIRGVGEISYDESTLKTISAYVDGRIEELYADYTGIEVNKGDSLALMYSPDLYAAQVEFVRTIEFADKSGVGSSRNNESNQRLLDSSRARLIEMGMTGEQINELESNKTPNSRLALHAPMSGTVIEKLAVAGHYLKAGMPVYRMADLSSVWLVLELFPEDASKIKIGQLVTATTQSMEGVSCEGKVEFVERTVDPETRTVGVRVSIDNKHGHLKPGEFVRATLKMPLLSKVGMAQEAIVVPRNSLLSIGQTSLVYVESKPGEFELRRVKTGPNVEGLVAVFDGLTVGENVVAHSTFLLDAQMQLQGNPSLMDPDKAVAMNDEKSKLTDAELEEIRQAMEPLDEVDRKLAESQVICPITEVRLGSMGMGTPIKIDLNGTPVFICCEGCRKGLLDDPEKSLKILEDYAAGNLSKELPKAQISQMDSHSSELPQMQLPQMQLPPMKLPDK